MYAQTTRSIEITVEPFYAEEHSQPEEQRYVFGYTITLKNQGHERVQLFSRHWKITDGLGRQTEVRGEGVVGEQPVLEPGQSFTYTSGAPLTTSSGFMSGTYQMRNDEGIWFDVDIPAFALDMPSNSRLRH